MRRFISTILVLVLLNLIALPVAAITESSNSIDRSSLDSGSVIVTGIQWDDYFGLNSEELDRLMYPSGMKIPTKYMDLLDFIPFENKFIYNDEVSEFLNMYYPEANGLFTYPEYKAVERLFYFTKLNSVYGSNSTIVQTLHDIEKDSNIHFFKQLSDVRLLDTKYLWDLLEPYQVLFESLGTYSEDVIDSLEYSRFLALNAEDYMFTNGLSVKLEGKNANSEYWGTLGKALDHYQATARVLGLSYVNYTYGIDVVNSKVRFVNFVGQELTTLQYVIKVNSSDEFQFRVQIDNENVVSGSERLLPTVDDYTRDEGRTLVTNPDASMFDVIDEVMPSGAYLSGSHAYGFRDVLGIVSSIFIAITIVVLWIISFVKNRKDPIKKWLDI